MKEKQHSVGGKELIPNTHSREVIKLHLSFCGMYDDLIGMSNTPTSPWLMTSSSFSQPNLWNLDMLHVSMHETYNHVIIAYNLQCHHTLIIGWTTCRLEDAKVTLHASNYIFYTYKKLHNNCGIFLVALLTITSTNQGFLFFIFVMEQRCNHIGTHPYIHRRI